MDNNYLKIDLKEGQEIFVEVKPGQADSSRVKEESPGMYNRDREFGEAIAVIRPLIDKVLNPLATLENKPKEVEIQFGFSIGSKQEVILNQDPKEAHIQVKLLFEP